MDSIAKQEAALAITKAMAGKTQQYIVRVIGISNSIHGVDYSEIDGMVADAKAINSLLPEDITPQEKQQVQRSVMDVTSDPSAPVIRAR